MTHIIDRISELQALPDDLHLFCPRQGDDFDSYFDEDLAGFEHDTDPAAIAARKLKVEQANDRKWLALDALQVLAFDGAEAEPYQTWIKDRIAALMTGCDVCVRVFHQSRGEWKTRLVDSYDEEMVHDFLKVIDGICIERICKGLDEAKEVLLAAEPKQRGVRILPSEATYAFFEALSCDAFIRNEELLQKHFDVPFGLVQTKKRLKLQTFVPAMTRFLFSKNTSRHEWAAQSWSGSKRNILPSEFEWTIRDHLMDAMMRVQMMNLDLEFTGSFWFAVKLIITKCDKDLITHNIRGLDCDFYKLALDHLSLKSEGFLDLIATITLLLEKSPTDFWDAMDAITPSTATVVEQVFNSPVLKTIFAQASEENKTRMEELDEAFTWVGPFVSSIKAANLTPACKAFSNLLFSRLQADHYSRVSRARCFKEGLWVLDFAFKKMNEGKNLNTFVGQPTVNGMLEILSTHIKLIVSSLKRFGDSPETKEDLKLTLSMIQQAFTLECQSLAVERQLITLSRPSPTETPPSSPIWTAIIKAIDANSIDLATHLLIAGKYLVGLEPLHMKPGVDKVPPTIRHFNDRFKLLSQSVTDVIDRLAEFDPSRLGTMLEQPAAATALISTLFSSTEDTRNSSVELLKVISGQDARRDALQYILKTYYKNVLEGVSSSSRQVMRKKTLAPAPSLIKTCSDIIDVMCNSQDGILRSRNLDSNEAGATMTLWNSLWDLLTMVFQMTEDWAVLAVYDKDTMKDFCRDTMQFADQLFDQCSIFVTALKQSLSDPSDTSSTTKLLKELLELPASTMEGMAKWLRLRDEFLSSKSVTLIGKLLVRLRRVSIEVDPETLSYMEGVLSGKIRAKLSMQQQAELLRALETHLGHSLSKQDEPVKQQKQGSISKWMAQGSTSSEMKTRDDVTRKSLLADASRTATAFQAKREAIRAREAAAAKAADANREAVQSEFKKKRQAELEKAKAEKAAAIAKARKERGLSDHTAEAGSGLEGLGVLGKEQAPKGEGLMHSSDESDDEGDFDDDLFGIKRPDRPRAGPKTNIVNEIKIQMPVKKRKVVRSMKDMRARLAPDLTQLHKTILSWDYFHNGDFPPNSRTDIYKAVPKTFRTPQDYQDVFQPLLTLEAWQGFVKSREENTIKPYEIRVVSRASIDAFQEVSSTMTHAENKELGLSEGDIVLLSQSKMPNSDDRYCLARVFRVQRKKAHLEVSYRVLPSNPLLPSLVPNGTVYGSKIQSITPLEREFGALTGLMYYDLCDEILRAKPSPLLTYKDSQLDPLINTYNVNKAQAKAVKSAIDNDAFTLIQGPPGSGKTKTIVAIVGAILSDSLRQNGTPINIPGQPRSDTAAKKLLVCAPSNAAVDELVMRFKDGVKTLSGQDRKLNIVRLGRSDAINAAVQDVTLEELVNRKLGVNASNGKDSENKQKIFDEHKRISEQLRNARDKQDSGTVTGADASKLQDEINALRRHKQHLGTKIDNLKDDERVASRNAELSRRRAQEEVLGNAHVICATLSGSGHEMFQGFSIEFETVIIDEAAQCVEMGALIPLKYGCSKCILVGDPKQLPPTVFSKVAARFQYEQSLFVRMQGNHPNDVHLLDTQYRMHPEISWFPSQTFYDGRLLDGGNMAGLRQRPWHASALLGPYRFFDVQGQHSAAPKGHSLINRAEIEIALQLYKRLTSDFGGEYDFRGKIGIITPYKSQLRELKNQFRGKYGEQILEDVEFNTTDAFQGRESEVIIFSCVRASPAGGIGFLQDIRRMNVGLTRAKSSLWVLGNSQSLVRGEFWRKLVEDAKDRKRYTDGNLQAMLKKHSSNFPAPKELVSYTIASHQQKIKQELKSESMSRTPSNDSLKPDPYVKQEIKQEIKSEEVDDIGILKNNKQGFSTYSNEIDMEDAPSEDSAATPNTESRHSTPASNGTPATEVGMKRKAETLVAAPTPLPGQVPGDVFGGMPKPKIRRRPRPTADPFMPKKKPKPG